MTQSSTCCQPIMTSTCPLEPWKVERGLRRWGNLVLNKWSLKVYLIRAGQTWTDVWLQDYVADINMNKTKHELHVIRETLMKMLHELNYALYPTNKFNATFVEMRGLAWLMSSTWHPSEFIIFSDLNTCTCVDTHWSILLGCCFLNYVEQHQL